MSDSKTKMARREAEMSRAIVQSTPTIVGGPCMSAEDEIAAMDRLLTEAGACLECGEVLVASATTWQKGLPFPMRVISLRCPKCCPVDSDSPPAMLRQAATDAREALAKIAGQAEADDNLQLAHYCRHRVDALDAALQARYTSR